MQWWKVYNSIVSPHGGGRYTIQLFLHTVAEGIQRIPSHSQGIQFLPSQTKWMLSMLHERLSVLMSVDVITEPVFDRTTSLAYVIKEETEEVEYNRSFSAPSFLEGKHEEEKLLVEIVVTLTTIGILRISSPVTPGPFQCFLFLSCSLASKIMYKIFDTSYIDTSYRYRQLIYRHITYKCPGLHINSLSQ